MERNQSIDLIKIIAMIMVVRMHTGLNHSLIFFAPIGLLHGIISPAIPLFFMVSGYLMQSKMPDYRYVGKKILHILKFVFIVVSISCVLTGIFEHHPRPHSLYLWFVAGGNLWYFWYLGSTILLYLMAPYVCQRVASAKAHLLLAGLALVCTIVVMLNVYFQFEERFVILTFRLWTWLFFFVLGAFIREYGCSPHINWLWVLVAMGSAAVFINTNLSSKFDYLYGSLVCAAYAYCIFCACLNTPIHNSKVISELSALFLPVYTLHPFVFRLYENFVTIDIYLAGKGQYAS